MAVANARAQWQGVDKASGRGKGTSMGSFPPLVPRLEALPASPSAAQHRHRACRSSAQSPQPSASLGFSALFGRPPAPAAARHGGRGACQPSGAGGAAPGEGPQLAGRFVSLLGLLARCQRLESAQRGVRRKCVALYSRVESGRGLRLACRRRCRQALFPTLPALKEPENFLLFA